jgi:hypothetical protein
MLECIIYHPVVTCNPIHFMSQDINVVLSLPTICQALTNAANMEEFPKCISG